MESYDAFISYAAADGREHACVMKELLEAEGLKCWMDVNSIPIGARWRSEIEKAIRQSAALVVIVTKSVLQSEGVRDEWNAMQRREGWPTTERILPCLFTRERPIWLSERQHIDFVSDPTQYKQRTAALAARIRQIRATSRAAVAATFAPAAAALLIGGGMWLRRAVNAATEERAASATAIEAALKLGLIDRELLEELVRDAVGEVPRTPRALAERIVSDWDARRLINELLTVPQLRELCGYLKLRRSGKKAELMDRLLKPA